MSRARFDQLAKHFEFLYERLNQCRRRRPEAFADHQKLLKQMREALAAMQFEHERLESSTKEAVRKVLRIAS
jgi:hypothetical protein